MKKPLVMTLIGKDRPGLVQSLSTLVEQHGGNWTASRMVHLAGEFAGLLSIDVADERADALEAALAGLEGITVSVNRGSDPGPRVGTLRLLEVVGPDRPGIVRRVTEVIAALDINIEELETEVVSAPMSAEPHFKATARLWTASDGEFDTLQDRLEDLDTELMVDLKAEA